MFNKAFRQASVRFSPSLTPHKHWPREWVHGPNVHAAEVGFHGRGAELAIRRVPCLQDHLFPHIDFQERRDVGMKPVVPCCGFVSEPLTPVDLDAFHRSSCDHDGCVGNANAILPPCCLLRLVQTRFCFTHFRR